MPSSVDYKIPFMILFAHFQMTLQAFFDKVFSMPIRNLAAIMGSPTSRLTIHGPCICSTLYYVSLTNHIIVLDPRISYSGLLADCHDELDACRHLEFSKELLHAHFRAKYNKPPPASTAIVASTTTTNGSPQKMDFTSRYRSLPQAFTDEVQEYFKLPCENFDTCDPLRWWAGQCSQFPNLSRLARDILSISGEFAI
jgi:hypothetical protein